MILGGTTRQEVSQLKNMLDACSNMGCHLMGSMLDAGDLEALGTMAGEKSALFPRLKTGEWIINGISLGRPTKVLARERYSQSI